MQALLYCALQSVNISSIIISNQVRDNALSPISTELQADMASLKTMDTLLIQLFHKTCGVSFTEGWICGKIT